MRASLALVVILGSTVASGPGFAQPADTAGDKVDAKALLASGLKLFQAKDYLGALAVFRICPKHNAGITEVFQVHKNIWKQLAARKRRMEARLDKTKGWCKLRIKAA